MSWLHYETVVSGRRALVLFENRFASSTPTNLPELGWFGVYTNLESGAAYWNPDETDALNAIEDSLLRLCEQAGGVNAVYVRRAAIHGVREYYFYFGASVNLSSVLPRLQLLHPGYRIEFERSADAQWAHYGSWLAEARGV